jgi:hypothetical protein
MAQTSYPFVVTPYVPVKSSVVGDTEQLDKRVPRRSHGFALGDFTEEAEFFLLALSSKAPATLLSRLLDKILQILSEGRELRQALLNVDPDLSLVQLAAFEAFTLQKPIFRYGQVTIIGACPASDTPFTLPNPSVLLDGATITATRSEATNRKVADTIKYEQTKIEDSVSALLKAHKYVMFASNYTF